MKLTNTYKLPQTLLNLHELQRDEYSRGEARMSITQLMKPPRIDILQAKHFHEMEEDISGRLWAVLGTVIHHIMERGGDEEHLLEERLFVELDDWIISGGIDVQRVGNWVKLYDYKFSSAIKWLLQDFEDWETQLNCYAYLVHKCKGWDIEGLEVAFFVRDFKASLAKTNKDYPPAPCVPVPLKLWDIGTQENYLRARIRVHKDALRAVAWGDEPPHCTDKERWKRDSDWAVMKGDNKRATRVLKTEQEAKDWVRNTGGTGDPKIQYSIVERHDTPTRCVDNYCGVSKWCSQYQKELADENK